MVSIAAREERGCSHDPGRWTGGCNAARRGGGEGRGRDVRLSAFDSGATRAYEWRCAQLRSLARLVTERADELTAALASEALALAERMAAAEAERDEILDETEQLRACVARRKTEVQTTLALKERRVLSLDAALDHLTDPRAKRYPRRPNNLRGKNDQHRLSCRRRNHVQTNGS